MRVRPTNSGKTRSHDAALSDASRLSDSISTTICRLIAQSPDQTYSTEGAFIEGYEFDRARFRVPGGTYRAADPVHWLTLDVAAAALADAGFPEGEGLPREATGVFVGNTLTGEFSRANTMRLRWPYVRRVVRKVLEEDAWPSERRA